MAEDEDVPVPFVRKDPVGKETVSSLLQSWGLSELKSKFKSHQVEVRALFCLTEKDICELIPKIGRRAVFRSNLMEWRKHYKKRCSNNRLPQRNEPIVDETIPIPQVIIKDESQLPNNDLAQVNNPHQNHSHHSSVIDSDEQIHEEIPVPSQNMDYRRYSIAPPQRLTEDCSVNVNEILHNSYEGLQIIAYYEVNGNFDYSHRRRLVTLLINEVVRKNKWLVQEDFAKISRDIIQLFPREELTTYYTARNGSKNPKGCLYNKFLNLTRKLRQEGMLQYRNNIQLIPERISARHFGEIKCYRESS